MGSIKRIPKRRTRDPVELESSNWLGEQLESSNWLGEQLEQHNKREGRQTGLKLFEQSRGGLRLWKQSRTWSGAVRAESREQDLEVLKSSWIGRFWKLKIE